MIGKVTEMSYCKIQLSNGSGEVSALANGPIEVGDMIGIGDRGRIAKAINRTKPFAVAMEKVEVVPEFTAEVWDEEGEFV